MKRVLSLVVVACLLPAGARAQFFDSFNPKVSVNITHPPGFGVKVSRMAFGQAQGTCSDQIVDSLTQLFVDSGVEVIDRQHLDSILSEHHFNLSGYVDQQSAAELGKILGPASLAFVKVLRCATEKKSLYNDWQDYKKNWHRTQISQTQAFLKVSLQTVDLATARILKARTFEANPVRKNEAEGGQPEFPSEFELQDSAISNVVQLQIRKMYFPWNETVELYYYDDKDCNMRAAFNMLKAGDKDAALKQSLENVDGCKSNPKAKPKHVGRAYYNAGMSYLVLADYDHALEMLHQAEKLYPYKIVTDALAQCNRAKGESSAMQEFEERMAVEASQVAQASAAPPPPPQPTQPAATPAPQPRAAAGVPKAPPEQRLKQLQELYEKGLLTKDEFEKKRAEILKEL